MNTFSDKGNKRHFVLRRLTQEEGKGILQKEKNRMKGNTEGQI
jgi:hypothetical protein